MIPPGRCYELAPITVGNNAEATETAFIWFLQPQQGIPLRILLVAPELQNICQIFAPDLLGIWGVGYNPCQFFAICVSLRRFSFYFPMAKIKSERKSLQDE